MPYILKGSNAGGSSNLTRYINMLAGNSSYIPAVDAYDSIATVNGTGTTTNLTFNNIPQNYTHLQLRGIVRTSYAAALDTIYVYNLNNNSNNSGSAYHFFATDGSTAQASGGTGSFSAPIGYCPAANALTNNYGIFVLDILDYTNTNKYKTLRTLFGYDNNGSGWVGLTSALPVTLPGTNAVSSLSVIFNGNINTNSQFSLYGVY